jgi:hypothetical protein
MNTTNWREPFIPIYRIEDDGGIRPGTYRIVKRQGVWRVYSAAKYGFNAFAPTFYHRFETFADALAYVIGDIVFMRNIHAAQRQHS